MSGLTFLGFVGMDHTVRKQVSRHVGSIFSQLFARFDVKEFLTRAIYVRSMN